MKTTEFFKTLGSQNLSHLERDSGVSRQALHNATKTHNMKLDNLTSVAKALNLQVELTPRLTEKNLLASLAKWGAPLAHSKDGNLSFEQTVREALKRSREDGVYETLLPYLLYCNVGTMNSQQVVAAALFENQVNALGYFVELANRFRPHDKFKLMLKLLEPAKFLEKEYLVLSTKSHYPELFEKNDLALKWNLKTRGSVDGHLQRWVKWDQSHKRN